MTKIAGGIIFAMAIAGFVSFVMTYLGAGPHLRLAGVLGSGLGTLVALSRVDLRL